MPSSWRTQLLAIALAAVIGVSCGFASAAFLYLLDEVTSLRIANGWLLYLLPIAGLALGFAYARFGESVKAGNNLVIDTIHDGGPEIPLRMFPMVLVGTLLTHLCGGSAGREGTAVQMGASLTDWIAHRVKLDGEARVQLLAAGVAGGFGSVFGTPIAGTIFGLEFVRTGRIEYRALAPALVAAITGDYVTRRFIAHTAYPAAPHVPLDPLLAGKWIVFAICVAATSIAFIEGVHGLKKLPPKQPWLRAAIGGAVVVGLALLAGDDYLGLGVPKIVAAFDRETVPWAFALKLAFTAITIGSGFIGGEVTPLFFIGATLGGVLGPALGIPQPLGAAVGMAAVFASASKTPIALSIMAVELVGGHALPHVAIVCIAAHLLTGRRSIYPSQLR